MFRTKNHSSHTGENKVLPLCIRTSTTVTAQLAHRHTGNLLQSQFWKRVKCGSSFSLRNNSPDVLVAAVTRWCLSVRKWWCDSGRSFLLGGFLCTSTKKQNGRNCWVLQNNSLLQIKQPVHFAIALFQLLHVFIKDATQGKRTYLWLPGCKAL